MVQYMRPQQIAEPQGCYVQKVHTNADHKLDQAIQEEIDRFQALYSNRQS